MAKINLRINTFTMLYNHHHYPFFIIPNRNSIPLRQQLPIPPSPQPLVTTILPFISIVAVVQSHRRVRLFRPHEPQHTRLPLSFTISWSLWSLLKLMLAESVMPSNHLILCRPLLFLPSTFPSIRVFSNESALLIRGP